MVQMFLSVLLYYLVGHWTEDRGRTQRTRTRSMTVSWNSRCSTLYPPPGWQPWAASTAHSMRAAS
eukprot:18706-Chlamydomonas_euryale.AAC.1